MKRLFYLKLIYIAIMFFFVFTTVLAQSELKMEDPLYQQGKILGRNFKVTYQNKEKYWEGILRLPINISQKKKMGR